MQRAGSGLSEGAVEAYLRAYFELKSRYFRVIMPLFIASASQAWLYSSVFTVDHAPVFDALWLLIAGTPWFVCFIITFIQVPPPISAVAFRRILLFVTYWYGTSTVLLLIPAVVRSAPMPLQSLVGGAAVWVCALLGWVAVPTLLRCSRALRDAEAAS